MIARLWNQYAGRSAVGLDIGSAFVKAAEVVCSKGTYFLKRSVLAEVNGSGPAPAVRKALGGGNFCAGRLAAGVASPETIVRPFLFPRMPRRELACALKLEAESSILNGHQPHEMAVDWQTFEAQPDGQSRGLLAVVPKELLSARNALIASAGYRPNVVDIQGLALWNAFWLLYGCRKTQDKTVLLLNIGKHSTNLVIISGRDGLKLLRDFELGLDAIDGGRYPEWEAEIGDSLMYARSSSGLRETHEAYITGGGAVSAAASALERFLKIPVQLWNPLDHLEAEQKIDRASGPLFAGAIGLSLRMIK